MNSLYLGTHEWKEGIQLLETLKSQAGEHIGSKELPSKYDIEHNYDNMLVFVKHHYDKSMEIWILLKSRGVL